MEPAIQWKNVQTKVAPMLEAVPQVLVFAAHSLLTVEEHHLKTVPTLILQVLWLTELVKQRFANVTQTSAK